MAKGHSKAEATQETWIDHLYVLMIAINFGGEAVSFFCAWLFRKLSS